jgi:hypothetical protein
MGLRHPAISRKINGHWYSCVRDYPVNYYEAHQAARKLREKGYSVRVVKLQQGYFVYRYPST